MGLRRIDKLIHSHGPAHKPHKVVSAQLEHLWCWDEPRANTQDSPRPGLGGSHHLPPYSILCSSPRGPHPNGFSLPGLPGFPGGSPKIAPTRTPATLEPHNFARRRRIEVRSKAKLQLSSRAFQWYVARCLQLSKSGRFPTFFWSGVKLAVRLPTPSFVHNLCFRCPKSNASPFQASTFQEPSNDIKNATGHCILTHQIGL